MFVQLQFDQEARCTMILQLGNFKGNVTWFLFFEYFIYLNAVISKAAELLGFSIPLPVSPKPPLAPLSPLQQTECKPLPISSTFPSELTMEQQLAREFCNRPDNKRCLAEAHSYLIGHDPIPMSAILYWREPPSPAANLSSNSESVETDQMTCFQYSHSGLWKQTTCEFLPPETKGHTHKVLLVIGSNGTMVVVDWDIGEITPRYRSTAVLMICL